MNAVAQLHHGCADRSARHGCPGVASAVGRKHRAEQRTSSVTRHAHVHDAAHHRRRRARAPCRERSKGVAAVTSSQLMFWQSACRDRYAPTLRLSHSPSTRPHTARRSACCAVVGVSTVTPHLPASSRPCPRAGGGVRRSPQRRRRGSTHHSASACRPGTGQRAAQRVWVRVLNAGVAGQERHRRPALSACRGRGLRARQSLGCERAQPRSSWHRES